MQAKCENCGCIWREQDLAEVKDLTERVASGEPMPAGECPSCGAVCHVWEESPKPFVEETYHGDFDQCVGSVNLSQAGNKVRVFGFWTTVGQGPFRLDRLFGNLNEARECLIRQKVVKPQYWAVSGRIPYDDDDTLLAIECWPWEEPLDLFARELAEISDKVIPVNWGDTLQQGGEAWVYVINQIQFSGPPVNA